MLNIKPYVTDSINPTRYSTKMMVKKFTIVQHGIYYAEGKPSRVSITRVERELGAPCKQMHNLLKCKKYIEDHLETQNEYRARQVTWAVKLFVEEGRYLSLNKLNHFLSYRKNDVSACFSLITDPMVKKIVTDLLAGETIPERKKG